MGDIKGGGNGEGGSWRRGGVGRVMDALLFPVEGNRPAFALICQYMRFVQLRLRSGQRRGWGRFTLGFVATVWTTDPNSREKPRRTGQSHPPTHTTDRDER